MIYSKDIGISCIKFQNHNKSNSELENLIYEVNDLLFFYAPRQINITAKTDILTTIEAIGKKAKDIVVDDKVQPRKDEFLTSIRKIYKKLRDVSVGQIVKEDKEYIQKIINYQIALSIKVKEKEDDVEILKQLTANKKVMKIYVQPFIDKRLGVNLNLHNFCKIQGELLSMIGRKYNFNDELF